MARGSVGPMGPGLWAHMQPLGESQLGVRAGREPLSSSHSQSLHPWLSVSVAPALAPLSDTLPCFRLHERMLFSRLQLCYLSGVSGHTRVSLALNLSLLRHGE